MSIIFWSGVSIFEFYFLNRELSEESIWSRGKVSLGCWETVNELLKFEKHELVLTLGVRESEEDLF